MNYKIIATTFEVKRSGRTLVLPLNDIDKALSLIPSDMEVSGPYTDIFRVYVESLSDTNQIKQIFDKLIPWISDPDFKNEFCYRAAQTLIRKFPNEEFDSNLIYVLKTCLDNINYGGYLCNIEWILKDSSPIKQQVIDWNNSRRQNNNSFN